MGVNGEALQLHAVYKKPYFILQVMRESVYHHSTKLFRKSITPSVLLLVLRTRNNTDGNKLVVFSSIALYYGDTYIIADFEY